MNQKCICKICDKEYVYSKAKGHSKDICNACRQEYRKKLLKHKAVQYKGGKCQDCGYDECEEAMEFHHLDPSQKSFSISGKYNLSWEKLKEELDKCILLCSNCHKKRHANDHISLEDYQKWIVPQSVRTEKAKERKEKHEQQAEAVAQKYSVNKDVFEKIRLGGRKVIRPSKDDFFKEYEEVHHNKSEMGRRYGVSSNAIRKWIESYKKYGI